MSSSSGTARAAAAKAAPKKWEFVNFNEPKKHQDKEVISAVRAHAMRDVRRKQRLELTAQHQKQVQAVASQSCRADSGVTADHRVEMDLGRWLIDDKINNDWLVTLRDTLSKLDNVNLSELASRTEAEHTVERDEYAQRPDRRQGYEEDKVRASKRAVLGVCRIGSPQSLVGDGIFDPFNAMPIPGWTNYNGKVLNHCRCLFRNTFLFCQSRVVPDSCFY